MKLACFAFVGAVASGFWKSSTAECAASEKACPFAQNEYRPFTLMSYSDESHDSRVFRFALPAADMPLNIEPSSCITLRFLENGSKEVARPYTPISRCDQRGYFEILVKKYKDCKMGSHLFSLKPGDVVEARGPVVQLPLKTNQYKTIGMIAGGTGIAPMYQIARHTLADPKNTTEISLLYANKTKEDVLLGNELSELRNLYPNFSPYFMVSEAPQSWMGGVGHISKQVISALMPPPQRALDSIILVCGPPSFMKNICGEKQWGRNPPRQGDLQGYLKEMGYHSRMVFKL